MAGFLVLLDQYLRTEWLSLTVIPAIGLILLATGLNSRRMVWIIPGMLVGALGLAGVILFGSLMAESIFTIRLGWAILSLSSGFLGYSFLFITLRQTPRLVVFPCGLHSGWNSLPIHF